MYCAVWTPIKIPTWRHIAQLELNIRGTEEPWVFFKTYHEAAYKQLPLAPAHAGLAMVALRHPTVGTWFVFTPRSLLFGAEAAVAHYNFRSRDVAVLADKIFGMQIISYSNALDAIITEGLSQGALDPFQRFIALVVYLLKKTKTDIGIEATFPGHPRGFRTRKTECPPEIARYRKKRSRRGPRRLASSSNWAPLRRLNLRDLSGDCLSNMPRYSADSVDHP